MDKRRLSQTANSGEFINGVWNANLDSNEAHCFGSQKLNFKCSVRPTRGEGSNAKKRTSDLNYQTENFEFFQRALWSLPTWKFQGFESLHCKQFYSVNQQVQRCDRQHFSRTHSVEGRAIGPLTTSKLIHSKREIKFSKKNYCQTTIDISNRHF